MFVIIWFQKISFNFKWKDMNTPTLLINSGYPPEQLWFSSLHPNSALLKRAVVDLWPTTLGLQPNPACGRTCTQARSSSQDYKSCQDTLLNNFDFLHNTQTLQCLKDQWWAFGPPLSASGPILDAFFGWNDLGGSCKTFFIFWYFS